MALIATILALGFNYHRRMSHNIILIQSAINRIGNCTHFQHLLNFTKVIVINLKMVIVLSAGRC